MRDGDFEKYSPQQSRAWSPLSAQNASQPTLISRYGPGSTAGVVVRPELSPQQPATPAGVTAQPKSSPTLSCVKVPGGVATTISASAASGVALNISPARTTPDHNRTIRCQLTPNALRSPIAGPSDTHQMPIPLSVHASRLNVQ